MPQGYFRSGHTGKDVRAVVPAEGRLCEGAQGYGEGAGSPPAPPFQATGRERGAAPQGPWDVASPGLDPCPSGKPARPASAAVAGPSGHVGFANQSAMV